MREEADLLSHTLLQSTGGGHLEGEFLPEKWEKKRCKSGQNTEGSWDQASIHGSKRIEIEICEQRKKLGLCNIAGSSQVISGPSWSLLGAFGAFGGVFILVSNDDGGGGGGKSDSHYVNVGKILG